MPVTTDSGSMKVRAWRRSLGGMFALLVLLASTGWVLSLGRHEGLAQIWIAAGAVFAVGSASTVIASARLRRGAERGGSGHRR